MRRISTTQRVLGGALLIVAVVWGVDRMLGGARVASARASPQAAAPSPAAPADWEEVNRLVARLTDVQYRSVAGELTELRRDLFLPSVQFENKLALEVPPALAAAPPPAADSPPEPDFPARHKLSGVVIGQEPLAVIDGRLLPLYAELDGYTLVEVYRDYVVLQQLGGDERVSLVLEQRSARP